MIVAIALDWTLPITIFAVALVAGFFLSSSERAKDERGDSLNDSRNEKPARQSVMLGAEYARAREKEKIRIGYKGAGHSPLPSENYSTVAGEWGLVNPSPRALDMELRGICERFREMPAAERLRFSRSIPMDGLYTLMAFSDRAVVFGLRSGDAGWVRAALSAVAMIEYGRIDNRDFGRPLGLVRYGAEKMGLDARNEILDAAELAESETKEMIADFAARPSEALQHSLYAEVKTEAGIGFVELGIEPFAPKTNLFGVATAIATAIEADVYLVQGIELATEMPDVWLKHADPAILQSAIADVRAGATIRVSLRPERRPMAKSQLFLVFVVEVNSTESAGNLLQCSRVRGGIAEGILGVAHGNVFALIVGRSFMEGVVAFETADSIKRFYEPVLAAMQKAA